MTSRKRENPEPSHEGRKTFPLRVDARLHEHLAVYADLTGRSMNEIAVHAVERFLADPDRKAMLADEVRRRRQAREQAGLPGVRL